MKEISDFDLEKIAAGRDLSMKNPVAGMSEEQARDIAAKLGNGKDMGSWKTMTGAHFLKWWEEANKLARPLSDEE